MERVGQGGRINLDATFRDGANALVDPINPRVDIYNTNEIAEAVDLVPVRQSLGYFILAYDVPIAGILGRWRAHWDGMVNGVLVSGDDFFEVVAAGSVIVSPSMPWITPAEAVELTGVAALTENQLINAAYDIYDYMRWEPDFTKDFVGGTALELRQKRVLGHAIAWTAAHRLANPPLAQMERAPISKTVGRWSVTFDASGVAKNPVLPDRVRNMLAGAGLCQHAGKSSLGDNRETPTEEVIW